MRVVFTRLFFEMRAGGRWLVVRDGKRRTVLFLGKLGRALAQVVDFHVNSRYSRFFCAKEASAGPLKYLKKTKP